MRTQNEINDEKHSYEALYFEAYLNFLISGIKFCNVNVESGKFEDNQLKNTTNRRTGQKIRPDAFIGATIAKPNENNPVYKR